MCLVSHSAVPGGDHRGEADTDTSLMSHSAASCHTGHSGHGGHSLDCLHCLDSLDSLDTGGEGTLY